MDLVEGFKEEKSVEKVFDKYMSDKYMSSAKVKCYQEGKFYFAWIEITNRCPASCLFCYGTSIDDKAEISLSPEKMRVVIDDLKELQFHHVYWGGGEPLVYPHLFELMEYVAEKGMSNGVFSNGIPITQKMANQICRAYERKLINVFGIHIDTLDQQIHNQIHENPKELQARIEGYRNLLDAGYPPDRILPCITLTHPSAQTFEETFDWFIGEMGARFLEIMVFMPLSRGAKYAYLEPSLSEVRRCYEYRAQRFGDPTWTRMGSTECTTIHCRTHFLLTSQGDVMTCSCLPRDFAVGNVHEERLKDIFDNHWESIALKDITVKGKCADCENNDICVGCRAKAYYYAGDISASDPKCWLNPEAKETYFR